MKKFRIEWFAGISPKSLVLLALSLGALLWVTGAIGQSRPAFGLVGLWPGYLRGDVTCVAAAGKFAYVGLTVAGPGGCERGWRGCLEVMDITDPARPVWVSSRNFRDPIRRIQATSNYVYVASGPTFHVLAVTNASLPILSGWCNVSTDDTDITSFQLKGQYVYAVRDNGLDVLDISNPGQPVVVGSSGGGFWGGSGVQVVGNRAYVAAGGGLQVYDMSVPSHPENLSRNESGEAYAVEVVGSYAYLTTAVDLRIISITNTSQPTLVGTNALGAGAKAIGRLGNYLYLAVSNRLEVLDITDPTQPRGVGGYDTGGSTTDVVVTDHYAFVAAGSAGLQILDLSDPARPALVGVGSRETGGPAEGIQVVGNYAYLADGNSGLQVIDLANTNGLVRMGQFKTRGYARAVHIVGNYAYVAAGFREFIFNTNTGTERDIWREGLHIIDVSSPASPARLGSFDTAQQVEDVQVVGNFAYLAAYFLEVVDVSDPAQPRLVATSAAVNAARAVQVVGQYAYVAGQSASNNDLEGLVVMDVSNPAQPQLAGACQTVAPAQDVHVVSNRAYVVASTDLGVKGSHKESWLQIIDVSKPNQPTPLGQCQISEEAHALQVVGRYAYVAGGSWSEEAPGWRDGLMVVDVSDPSHPTRVGGLSTPGWAAGLQVVGDQVYLANGPAGLAIVSLPTAGLTIVEEPQCHPVFYGNSGTQVVGAYSAAPISYQWYQSQSGDTSHPVTEATNASYTVSAVTQNVSYWVRVSSGTNMFDTSSATLMMVPLAVWGDTSFGLTNAPAGLTNPVAIAAGEGYSLALTAEGWVVAWGMYYHNDYTIGPMTVPSGLSNVVAIAVGENHNLALTAAGRVAAWGRNDYGQTTMPSGLSNVVAIAAGFEYSLALTAEGRVGAWGRNDFGQTTVPSGLSNVVGIAAGGFHSLALTADGRVVAWDRNDCGQTTVPSGLSNVVGIAAGEWHSLALTAEGQVVGWGLNNFGQATVPSGLGNVVAIAAGAYHSLALTAEGRVVAWGANPFYPTNVPSGLSNVVGIAARSSHSLALLQQPKAPTPRLELSRGLSGLELRAQGAPGISCQLLRASQLPGPWLPSEPVTFTNHIQWLRSPNTSAPAQFFRLLRK